jgi:16S rRNA (guanine966-N2)-methyltransferase
LRATRALTALRALRLAPPQQRAPRLAPPQQRAPRLAPPQQRAPRRAAPRDDLPVRVIAGRFGGRQLSAPKGRATRPTSDRVREALFSILGELGGMVVLDLFAGTGALAIEALSRGAARAVLVERDQRALSALKANLAELGIGSEQAEVRPGEAAVALRNARERKETYDLVFVDPPYRHTGVLGPELREALGSLLRPRARVVVESDRRTEVLLRSDLMEVEMQRRYGDTMITIHRRR